MRGERLSGGSVDASTMHFGVAQASAFAQRSVWRESRNGRPYLVAPVTMCREGVLNDAFVSFDALADSAAGWNGQVVTPHHPTNDDGEFVSANQPDTSTEHIGTIMNARADSDDRTLTGEVWVNEVAASNAGGMAARIARTLAAHADTDHADEIDEDASVLGVSIGYHHDKHATTGTFDGEQFSEQHTGLLPDHLAVFPADVDDGACSIEDGCGVPNTQLEAATDGGTDTADTGSDDRDADGIDRNAAYSGDRVRWKTNGDHSQRGYGVIVDELDDGPVNAVRVAVYEPDDDENSWQATNTTRRLSTDRLTRLAQFPPITNVLSAQSAAAIQDADDVTTDDTDGILRGAMNVLDRARSLVGGSDSTSETSGSNDSDPDDGDHNCSCQPSAHSDSAMKIDIETLAEHSAFTAEELEDDDLRKKVAETIDIDPDGDDGTNGTNGADGNDGSGGDATNQDVADGDGAGEPLTADDIRSIVSEEIAANTAAQNADDDRAYLAANTDLSDEDLKELSASELHSKREAVEAVPGTFQQQPTQPGGVNYAGRGQPTTNTEDSDGDGYIMESPLATATKGGDD